MSRTNKNLGEELLTPAKKYLPTVAVLEGFPTLEAKKRFVESVNKNNNIQNINPNSFKIYKNLFYSCHISNQIKSYFIGLYTSLGHENKIDVFETILYCLDYDFKSLDFLMSKIYDITSCYDVSSLYGLDKFCYEILRAIKERIFSQSFDKNINYYEDSEYNREKAINHRKIFIKYFIENMNKLHCYYFVDLCIPPDANNIHYFTDFLGEYTIQMAKGSGDRAECISASKVVVSILMYLRSKKLRYNNNKTCLIFYKILFDSSALDSSCEILINWYFKNFTMDDIECIYRINPSIVIRSESLFVKINEATSYHIKAWLLSCIKRMLSTASNYEIAHIHSILTGIYNSITFQHTNLGIGSSMNNTILSNKEAKKEDSDSVGLSEYFEDDCIQEENSLEISDLSMSLSESEYLNISTNSEILNPTNSEKSKLEKAVDNNVDLKNSEMLNPINSEKSKL